MKSLGFLLLFPCVLAFELPFSVSALFSSKTARNATTPSSLTRIAIIGAGAGGSSAAFWISKAKERSNLDVQVDVYEAADYIGGRASVLTFHTHLLIALNLLTQDPLSYIHTTTSHFRHLSLARPSLWS